MRYMSLWDVRTDMEIGWQFAPKERIFSWIASGRMPCPEIIDGVVRWRRDILERWEDAGHPRSGPPSDKLLDEILQALHAEACRPANEKSISETKE